MTGSAFRVAALVVFAALLATNLYRAATQSIVHDEALTWQLYLAGPASAMFHQYDPNNHFLATVLFRISTTLFGDSALAMRLPTVLAGAWFFWTVFRLCELVFGGEWLFLLGCAVLSLNPILLDFLVAARGYGLAMAGLFWALYQMLSWFQERANGQPVDALHKRLWKAALGCSIAVAANLTLLTPVFLIAAAFCVLLLRPEQTAGRLEVADASQLRKKSKKAKPEIGRKPARSFASFAHFAIPVAALAIVFLLAAPIDLVRSEDLYAGTSTAAKSLRNLMEVSFAYGNGPSVLREMEQIWSDFALVFLPLASLAALIASSITVRREPSIVCVATLLASLAVVGSAILLTAAHFAIGIPYPEDRTGIYFVPLASLAALGLARLLSERRGWFRYVGFAVALVLLSFTLEFAAQWNAHSFWVWRYDADTKRIFDAMEAAKPAGASDGQIRLGASWQLEPALNYYRAVRKATWMAPVLRDGFDGPRQFYILASQDQNQPSLPPRKTIFEGPVSGTELAIPQSAQ